MNTINHQLFHEAQRRLIAAKIQWIHAAEAEEYLHWSKEKVAESHADSAADEVKYAERLFNAAGLSASETLDQLTKAGIQRTPHTP